MDALLCDEAIKAMPKTSVFDADQSVIIRRFFSQWKI
jgi:hypothetical protein